LEEVRFRAFRCKSPYRWRKAEGFSPTFRGYTRFGTKLAIIFGLAKTSKYKTNFRLSPKPKSRVTAVMGRLFLSKLQFSHKVFKLLLAKSNFQFCFACSLSLESFGGFNFPVSVGKIQFSSSLSVEFVGKFRFQASVFQVSTFQVFVGKFQLSLFSFSSVYNQIPILPSYFLLQF
jgi:hypothetical protein